MKQGNNVAAFFKIQWKKVVIKDFISSKAILWEFTEKYHYSVSIHAFCIAKKTSNKMKRQSVKWEKIFAHYISDKM